MTNVTEEEYLTHLCTEGTGEICETCVQYETNLLELNEKEKMEYKEENVPEGYQEGLNFIMDDENEIPELGTLPDEPDEVNE